jgi:signal transduction histidine kinase
MNLRVLLVDDSLADRTAVRRALERDPDTHWEVEQVDTAEAALEHLSLDPPDVVLMDLNLPGMNGVELLRTLRERCGECLAAVLLTGSGTERTAVAAMKSGAQDYLLKEDFSPERVRHSLRRAVETVRRARELEEHRRATERAERAAREALAVRDELFSLATHDLKGPLQLISLNAQMLQRQLPSGSRTPALENRLETIVRATHRMGVLIDHFLRMTRGQERPLQRHWMDLLALVRAKVREVESSSGRHRVVLMVQGEDFSGHWDASQLERVLDNLLGNAVKYSPGGGTLTVSLTQETPGSEGWVRVGVADEGIGIPARDLPYVFERFHRGGNVDPEVAGSGVGLASARRLVELHGGTIEVESEEGQGSRFWVRLPRELHLPAVVPEAPP